MIFFLLFYNAVVQHVFNACYDIVNFRNANVLRVFSAYPGKCLKRQIRVIFIAMIVWFSCTKENIYFPYQRYANQPQRVKTCD